MAVVSFGSPTENSRIRERHFTQESYPALYAVSENHGLVGKPKRKDLRPTAIPTNQRPAACFTVSWSVLGWVSSTLTTTVSPANAGRRDSSFLTRSSTSSSQAVGTPIVANGGKLCYSRKQHLACFCTWGHFLAPKCFLPPKRVTEEKCQSVLARKRGKARRETRESCPEGVDLAVSLRLIHFFFDGQHRNRFNPDTVSIVHCWSRNKSLVQRVNFSLL